MIFLGISLGSIAILITLFSIIVFYYKKNKEKNELLKIGKDAELAIGADLKAWAKKQNFQYIKSNLFKYDKNKFYEVDGILFTSFAILIVEIKSISGNIIGNGNDLQLKKIIGKNEHKINNPILQNEKHIKHFQKMTNTKLPILSLIIFSNRANYVKIKDYKQHVIVTVHRTLYQILNSVHSALPNKISTSKIKAAKKQAASFIVKSPSDKREFEKIISRKDALNV
ncbi:MAG: NERD domain-containing protein [Mycoplasma sp.]|nr:NERD domain-containing protein [Mycoplasma sp.]